jgi:putative endonuclease
MSSHQLYIGFTNNLRKRVIAHNKGKVFTTNKYSPANLIYYEGYLSKKDARRREPMLKKVWQYLCPSENPHFKQY